MADKKSEGFGDFEDAIQFHSAVNASPGLHDHSPRDSLARRVALARVFRTLNPGQVTYTVTTACCGP